MRKSFVLFFKRSKGQSPLWGKSSVAFWNVFVQMSAWLMFLISFFCKFSVVVQFRLISLTQWVDDNEDLFPCHLHTRSLFFVKNFFKPKWSFRIVQHFKGEKSLLQINRLSLCGFSFFLSFCFKLSRVCTDRDRGALVCWPKQRGRHNGGSHDFKTKKWRVRIWKKKSFSFLLKVCVIIGFVLAVEFF